MASRTSHRLIRDLISTLLTIVFGQFFFLGAVHWDGSEFTNKPDCEEVIVKRRNTNVALPVGGGASNTNGRADLQKSAHLPQEGILNIEVPEQRELAFSDLVMGNYVSRGSVNVVVEVKLPDWWYQQQKTQQQRGYFHVDENTKLVLKIATWAEEGIAEVSALRTLNADKDLAAKHNILPLVWGEANFENPYYAEKGMKPRMEVPESWGRTKRERLQGKKTISAVVVPDLNSLGQMYDIRKIEEMKLLRRFMRSFFATLDYAHSLGVNNNDLSRSNVFYDDNGDAIVMDWNGMRVAGQTVFIDDNDFRIVPPEAILGEVPVVKKDQGGGGGNEVFMKEVQHTRIGSFDVWSAGIMFVNVIFGPCEWISHKNFGDRHSNLRPYLKTVVHSVGGNAKIRVNEDGDESDLAAMVGLNSTEVAQTSFRPPLCVDHSKPCIPCGEENFSVLDSADEELRKKALDFMKKVLVLAPQDRPTAKELLNHPFLSYVEEE